MSRLHAELQRLYALTPPSPAPGTPADATPATDAPAADTLATGAPPDGLSADAAATGTRLLVLGLGRPADWPRLADVWQTVQAELGLPAPAIAVNGVDGFELWFALAQPLPLAQAAALADALRQRYLGDVPPARLTQRPTPGAARQAAAVSPPHWPGSATAPEQWSAFVAPDLAPMFAETPWLDLPPPLDGQAELLARLQPISADALAQAWLRLAPPASPMPAASSASAAASPPGHGASADAGAPSQAAALADEARRFLQRVMHDEQAALALRIEAAKALLAAG